MRPTSRKLIDYVGLKHNLLSMFSSSRAVQRSSLSCCERSRKQDCEGPRIKKSLKTALNRLKTIALISLVFAMRTA
jgi:hypothetical protein